MNNYTGYNPYQNYGYNTMMQQPFGYGTNNNYGMPTQQQSQPTNTNKIYVSGLDEVKTRILQPNSDFIFLDNDKPILYQKIVSPNGQFEVKAFEIKPYKAEEQKKDENSEYVKQSDLEPLKTEIQELKDKLSTRKAEVANGRVTTTATK